ncbi:MAG TPA: DUF2269 family protein [Gaiellaceae bacterium]|nr:DUF2269 family protein [Gaiellaceae bacterium]
MSLYTLLLFVHLTGAVVWLGGAVMAQLYALRALRSGDARRMAALTADMDWIGTRFLIPASLGVLLAGIGMVWESAAYGFGDDWIVIALVLFAGTFLAGAGFFGPESGRISKLLAEHGAEAPHVQARIRRILVLSRIDLVVLFLILFDMAVKPSFSDGWTISGALAVAAVAAAALTVRPARRRDAPAAVAAD